MNKNKFLALAMAGAMMTGTLATAVPVLAEDDNTTKVSLTVAQKNTYTMTVPAATELGNEGEITQLTNGISITNGTLEDGMKLTVTAESKNDWYMVTSDSSTTKIGYTLYSDEGTTEAKSWAFSQTDANNGAKKDVYAKANKDDVAKAGAGTYSDVITFNAKVETAKVAVESVELNCNWSELTVGDNLILEATVAPTDATDKTVTWTSSDDSVVTVDAGGTVAARASGRATITATVDGKTAECVVIVNAAAATVSFTYDSNSYTVSDGTTWSSFLTTMGLETPSFIWNPENSDMVMDYNASITAGNWMSQS